MKYSMNDDVINNQNNNSTREYNVSLFGLKDGEKAIVRFMIDSLDDFEVVVDHPNIEWENKRFQRVNCIRHMREGLEKCPFCNAGLPTEQIAYFKLIQYVKDASGNIVPSAKIWSRSVNSKFIKDLRSYLNDYGALSNMVCSISRSGSGFNDTTYTISPNLPSNVYPENVYTKNKELFDNYSVMGTIIKDWTFDEMDNFIKTGQPPVKKTHINNTVDNTPKMVYNNSNIVEELPFN